MISKIATGIVSKSQGGIASTDPRRRLLAGIMQGRGLGAGGSPLGQPGAAV